MANDRNQPLRVASMIATRKSDADRGPLAILNVLEARSRLLDDGEVVWVYGPRRGELATVRIDPSVRDGDVILRDIAGAAPSEYVRVVKPDLDNRGRRSTALV
jgi:anaerobic selenocysteine-containing dehydrogenase